MSSGSRIGCLGLLGLYAAGGVYLHLTDSFAEDGAGRWAMGGLLFLAVLLIANVLDWLAAPPRKPPPGFPIEPTRSDDEHD